MINTRRKPDQPDGYYQPTNKEMQNVQFFPEADFATVQITIAERYKLNLCQTRRKDGGVRPWSVCGIFEDEKVIVPKDDKWILPNRFFLIVIGGHFYVVDKNKRGQTYKIFPLFKRTIDLL